MDGSDFGAGGYPFVFLRGELEGAVQSYITEIKHMLAEDSFVAWLDDKAAKPFGHSEL